MPNYLDIFAGAGGLSEGFIRAGYEPVAHIEMDKAACYTLKTRLAFKWLSDHQQEATYTNYLEKKITILSQKQSVISNDSITNQSHLICSSKLHNEFRGNLINFLRLMELFKYYFYHRNKWN